ncbi:Palmitoyltransferase zdhhc15 [Perkinsus olseni]|uniref:Palmitoyltransferase n=1 Tax=Perkinsus olseni TaxID=32597 RepID=A0A7J6L9X6_PEROL|nr:Palmitoyltransferase zdhhc15 [Perkinsus olseni]
MEGDKVKIDDFSAFPSVALQAVRNATITYTPPDDILIDIERSEVLWQRYTDRATLGTIVVATFLSVCSSLSSVPMWFVVDCCGITCVTIADLLLLSAYYTIGYRILWTWMHTDGRGYGPSVAFALFNLFFVLSVWSHFACMLTDPGSVPLNKSLDEEDLEAGRSSGVIEMASRAISERCVLKMDHHCPWVNNCVGMCNQKHFMLLLTYVCMLCGLSVLTIAARLHHCHNREHFVVPFGRIGLPDPAENKTDVCNIDGPLIGFGILTFFFGLVFGLFTIIMLCDQTSAIIHNQTGVEQLQNVRGPTQSWRENIREVFNEGTAATRIPTFIAMLLPLPTNRSRAPAKGLE